MVQIKALFANILKYLDNSKKPKRINGVSTGTLTFTDITGGLLILEGAAASFHGLYTVYGASGGTMYNKVIAAPTNASITVSFATSHKIIITNGASGTLFATYITTHDDGGTWS